MGIDEVRGFRNTIKLAKFSMNFSSVIVVLFCFIVKYACPVNVCTNTECDNTAHAIINNMLPTVDPCEDFYEFACGGFKEKASIPEYEIGYSSPDWLKNIINYQIESEFRLSYESTLNFPAFQKAQDFYLSCINEDAIEERGLVALKAQLERLGGWPVTTTKWDDTKFDLTNTKIQLQSEGLDTELLFGLYITEDESSNRFSLLVDEGWLGLYYDFLIQGLENPVVQTYLEIMVDLAVELGAPSREEAKREMLDAIELEYYIAYIWYSDTGFNSSNYYTWTTIKQLEEDLPFISWNKLISESLAGVKSVQGQVNQVSPDEPIMVSKYFLTQLSELLKDIPKRTLANYILGRAVLSQSFYLTKKIQLIVQKMDALLYGIHSLPPRRETCMMELEHRFQQIVSAVYVRTYFDLDKKPRIEQLVSQLQAELLKVLEAAPFISPSSLENSKRKLNKLTYLVGAPKELYDDNVLDDFYQNLNTDPADFYENVIASNKFLLNFDLSLLHDVIDKTAWYDHSYSTLLDVLYIPELNRMDIPAALADDILYSSERPHYLNVGLLGFIIASRQMTLFNDRGIHYDEDGNRIALWDQKTTYEFYKREDKLGDAYSKYIDPDLNIKLNGRYIEGMVTSVQGGLKIAYKTFQNLASLKEQDRLVHLEQFSPGQLFWLWTANGFCSKIRPEAIETSIFFGHYPTKKFRINGPFRNSPNFASDWNCSVNSYMNPETKVNVW